VTAALAPVRLQAPWRVASRGVQSGRDRLATVLDAARSHPARRCFLGLAAISAISGTATAASPLLLTRAPMVLALLAPRLTFLSLAASQTPLPMFLILGVARLALADPLHYAIGRTVGAERGGWSRWPRPIQRLAVAASRLLGRLGVAARPACCIAILLRPNGLNLMWAGSLRLPKVLVAALDVVGTLGYLLVVHTGASALIQ
jgi:hypothetical protein